MAFDPFVVGAAGNYDDVETHSAARGKNLKHWNSFPVSKWAALHAVIGGAFVSWLSMIAPSFVPFLVGINLVLLAHVVHGLRAARSGCSLMDSQLMDVSRTLAMLQSQYPILRDGSNVRDAVEALRLRMP